LRAWARLLLAHLERGAQIRLGELGHARDERFILRRRLPVPCRLAGDLGQLVDGLDRALHLLVPEDHGAEHHVLGKLVRLGFDHHHALLGPRNDQIELGLLELRGGRIDHVLPVDVAHAAGADRPVERHARESERGRHREHRRDVGIDFRIQRHHLRHHLHLIEEPIRKQRADRAVDQARGERLLF
jgi:hypothetical protein